MEIVPVSLNITPDIQGLLFNINNQSFYATNAGSTAEVAIAFQRKVLYHLTNTYVPTISLLVLVESTLFLDDGKLDIILTLSLTSLLVIYTFFQSISFSLPKTTYLKFLDYWLIFCLLVPSAVVLIQTKWYFEDLIADRRAADAGKAWDDKMMRRQASKSFVSRNRIRVILPVFTLVATFIYAIIAAILYVSQF